MFDFVLEKKPNNENLKLLSLYDLIVIGAGPGGSNAALYAKRKGLEVLLVTKNLGGQMTDSNTIENYLGTPSITGTKLNNSFIDHLNSLNLPILDNVTVTKITKNNQVFHIQLNDKSILKAKTVIIATGTSPKKLNVKGEDLFSGKGIAYCAICDGPLYKGKNVLVAGSKNPALEIAFDSAKIAKLVTVVSNEVNFAADQVLIEKLKSLNNVNFLLNTTIKEFIGNEKLETVSIYSNNTNNEDILKVDGAFIHVGYNPNSDIVKDLVDKNSKHEIIVNNLQETSLEGLFAVGDVTNSPYKQIIIAASQGATAALRANEYITRKDVL